MLYSICMKNMIKTVLALALCMACGCTKQEERTLRDGTYTTSAQGYNGEVKAEVTFSEGAIREINITEENETKTWADSALENVPQYIINEQSVNVDVSSGATVTGNAIKQAVEKAIEEAGGNIEEWNEDKTGIYETEEETKETDVVIVGGGIAGMTCALRLRQADIECILIEEDEELGGALLTGSHYSQIVSFEETVDEEEVNTAEETINDIKEYSSDADASLLKILQENITDTVDWQISDLGIVFADEWLECSAYQKAAVKEYAESNGSLGALLGKEVEVSGTEVLTNTIMTKLEEDGIGARGSDGTIYHIKADNIVLATGASFTTDALSVCDSSAILAILDLTDTEESTTVQTNLAFEVDEKHAIDTYDADQEAMEEGFIIVNKAGERFVNETASRSDLNEACEEETYLVMSADAYAKWKESMNAKGDLTDEIFEEKIYHGETLLEACEKADLPFEELSQTVKLFNTEAENDASDIYQRIDLGSVIDQESDVYIVPLCKAVYAGAAGLAVNDSLQLINGEEKDNVYVIGSAVAHLVSDPLAEGLTNAWAFVSGKYVADALTEKTDA